MTDREQEMLSEAISNENDVYYDMAEDWVKTNFKLIDGGKCELCEEVVEDLYQEPNYDLADKTCKDCAVTQVAEDLIDNR